MCRGHSALGNPFVMRSEADRDAVCEAFTQLLARTVRSATAPDVWTVRAIGRDAGFDGEVREWDGERARDEIQRLWRMAQEGPLQLDCHCAPLRCHGEVIAALVAALADTAA